MGGQLHIPVLFILFIAAAIVFKIVKGLVKVILILILIAIAGIIIANRDEVPATSTEISNPAT